MILKPAVFLLAAASALAATWTFPAGPPELAKNGGIAFPMDDAAYAKYVEQTKALDRHVAVSKRPANLSPHARTGYNFVVGGNNRGWILDGDDEHGWALYLDWRGDGDLSQAEPQKLERVDGVYRLQVEAPDGDLRWPCRFELTRVQAGGKEQLAVLIVDGTVRRGAIELDGRQYPFRLEGARGKYDGEYNRVLLERFTTGAADSYKVSDRYLNLAGKSYEFTVDPLGRSLTLTELAETRPDRPALTVGSPAPDFTAADTAGAVHKLADYRGRMLLVEFWATSCGPCREEAPRMVELYRGLDRGKVEFLGVSSDTSEETLRGFLRDFKLAWPQVREPFEGAIHQLYRVAGEPTYYLVGADGKILDTWIGSGETTARIDSRMLETGTSGLISRMWKRSMVRLVRHRHRKAGKRIGCT